MAEGMVLHPRSCYAKSLACPQDSRSGELASLAYQDYWQAHLHLTLTKPVDLCFQPKGIKKILHERRFDTAVLVTSYIWQVADLITTLRGLGYRIFNSRTGDLVTSWQRPGCQICIAFFQLAFNMKFMSFARVEYEQACQQSRNTR